MQHNLEEGVITRTQPAEHPQRGGKEKDEEKKVKGKNGDLFPWRGEEAMKGFSPP